ncbi:MAG TPA: hypothetical protein VGC08_11675 [Pedobacter sp.]|jgi:hypothetical protein
MKKSKLRSLVKSARKTAKKDIKLNLISELKEIAGKFGQGSKKLERDIEKGSKQLAKKLSKDIKIDKSAIIEANKQAKAAVEETPAPEAETV